MLNKLKQVIYITFVILVVIALIFTCIFIIYDGKTRKIISNFSETAAKIKINTMLNDRVSEYLTVNNTEYSKLVNLTYGDNNEVKSLEVNSIEINKIKSGIVSSIQRKIASDNKINIKIPLGTILGNSFTLGRGPSIPIDLTMSSAVESNVISTFEGAGINQTLHRIILRLQINTYIVMPWYRSNCILETDFILAETVIVGKVPDAFTVVIESEEDNTGGLINDYGANNYN